jgi:hypothetical protein
VLKKYLSRTSFSATSVAAKFFFSLFGLSGGWQNGCCRSAEEPHEALDVLGHGCQEEMFPHELQSPQAQAPKIGVRQRVEYELPQVISLFA